MELGHSGEFALHQARRMGRRGEREGTRSSGVPECQVDRFGRVQRSFILHGFHTFLRGEGQRCGLTNAASAGSPRWGACSSRPTSDPASCPRAAWSLGGGPCPPRRTRGWSCRFPARPGTALAVATIGKGAVTCEISLRFARSLVTPFRHLSKSLFKKSF